MFESAPFLQDTLNPVRLYIAFELSKATWRLAFSDGGRSVRQVSITGKDLGRLDEEVAKAKQRFKLPVDCEVVSCYEAGRDGFWLHRYLVAKGWASLVFDSASIEVNRRSRRAKNDTIDANKLLGLLVRQLRGEDCVKLVHVPSEQDEDDRRLHRERERLSNEGVGHRNRLRALLVTVGVDLDVGRHFIEELASARLWNGAPVPKQLQLELVREYQRLLLVENQLKELEREMVRRVEEEKSQKMACVRQLKQMCGIGHVSAFILVMEFFGWRGLKNRREVAALAGLTPTPYDSGSSEREQGISKAGNSRVRWLMVELAWLWLRYQPQSGLSRWYRERFGQGARVKKVGIVALARKLLVALWQFVTHGVIPQGAQLKEMRLAA